ncbi:MAG: acyl-CoA mutase large subunit family protein [Planctomycetota bacterium]|jgi:methylmalonyl-CoA mutase N-terminal domain/subunit
MSDDTRTADKGFQEAFEAWKEAFEKARKLESEYATMSGLPLEGLYAPEGDPDGKYMRQLGFPGQFPYTRGIHPSMYRGRIWTMRQFAGFGTAVETNERYKFLLANGQTGLSVAFDFPTLMGYDGDHARSLGEVGRCGVAVHSLADMETLFDGIPMGEISTSMTINGPAAVVFAFYVAAADNQGVSREGLRGTIQNDILKEYHAQNSWIFPPEPSMRLVVDTFEFCAGEVPQWYPISISGYHIREAGSTAAQELAFTLADGFAYVKAGMERGLDVDRFAPRLSFFFNAHLDFFEEIAKYRAARRIWARHMRDEFGAKSPKSLSCRFHVQTAGCSLTAQEPYNNVVRTALEGLAAVMGGCQSLHTNSLDESYALPTENAVRVALRTQQLMACEHGVASVADPLGGSYFVEALTDRLEQEAEEYFRRIESLGGMFKAIEDGFFRREIAAAAAKFQRDVDAGRQKVVGVNCYQGGAEQPIELLRVDPSVEKAQRKRLADLRKKRDNGKVKKALEALRAAAEGGENLMPLLLDAAHAYATLGETTDVLREVFGEYTVRDRISA